MSTENLQHLQGENYSTTPQISGGNNQQLAEGKELIEATVFEPYSEQVQEVLQNIKLEMKLKSKKCIKIIPCPTNNSPQGCKVC
ncbi:hypothetical protein CAL7716_060480 [Calothrix sp. PCC 7716]|nr:hypothetical protein CAL7716_060480 [Calothrix sp. PCC 7716]